MTQENFPHNWGARVIELGKIAGAIAAIGALFTLLWGWVGPIRTIYHDWMEMKETTERLSDELELIHKWQLEHGSSLQMIQTTQQSMLVTLDGLTKPKEIFETNTPLSGARDGWCILGEQCGIDVRIRRTMDGVRCQLVPGEEKFYFIEVESGSRVQVFRTSGTPLTNVGRDWFDYHWVFETPTMMKEPSGFMYEFSYTNCRGPTDDEVIRQESDIVRVDIMSPQEAADQVEFHLPTVDVSP